MPIKPFSGTSLTTSCSTICSTITFSSQTPVESHSRLLGHPHKLHVSFNIPVVKQSFGLLEEHSPYLVPSEHFNSLQSPPFPQTPPLSQPHLMQFLTNTPARQ